MLDLDFLRAMIGCRWIVWLAFQVWLPTCTRSMLRMNAPISATGRNVNSRWVPRYIRALAVGIFSYQHPGFEQDWTPDVDILDRFPYMSIWWSSPLRRMQVDYNSRCLTSVRWYRISFEHDQVPDCTDYETKYESDDDYFLQFFFFHGSELP